MRPISRRTVLTLPLLAGCGWGSSPSAEPRPAVPSAGTTRALGCLKGAGPVAELGRGLLAGDFVLEEVIHAVALGAVRHCSTEAVPPSGAVSHALAALASAAQVLGGLPPSRRAVPILQAAGFVAREMQHSPYAGGAWALPEPGVAELSLADAIRSGAIEQADAAMAAAPEQLAPVLGEVACSRFGHLGHGAIIADACRTLWRRTGDPGLLRASARHLASFPAPDDTRVRVARGSARLARAQAGEDVVEMAARLALSVPADQDLQHLLTAARAASALGHPNAAAAWLDMVEAGVTEVGALAPGTLPVPRRGTLDAVMGAIKTSDEGAAAVLGLGCEDPRLWPFLIEHACSIGDVTIQHAIKNVAAAGRGPMARGLVCRFVAWRHSRPDDLYLDAVEALGLEPQPDLLPA